MSIWNKVLLFLIAFASLALFWLSAWMLKCDKNWRDLAVKYDREISKIQAENALGEARIAQTHAELAKLVVARNRAWYHCEPQKITKDDKAGTASVKVTIKSPDPHGIAEKAVLYVFEESNDKEQGQYLGEFKVTGVSGKEIGLTLAFKPTEADMKKLGKPVKLWTLYDVLPRDHRETLAELTEEQKKTLLPADTAEEFVKDGRPAAADDPAGRKIDGKYVRPLRDYASLFQAYRMEIAVLQDFVEAKTRDVQLVEDALADAKRQVQFLKDQKVVVTGEKEKFAAQLDAVDVHFKKVKEILDALTDEAKKLIDDNKAMAGQIAKIELDAIRRIDERSRAMAATAKQEK